MNTIVIRLNQTKSEPNLFYAPQDNMIPTEKCKEWRSSENFQKFHQLPNQHQLVLSQTGEMVFFIPSLQHQKFILSEDKKMRNCLALSVEHKRDQMKKTQDNKKRRVSGKWIFTGSKWSPFENGGDFPLGITQYSHDKWQVAYNLGNKQLNSN